MVNEHIHSLYQFVACHVRHLLATVICSSPLIGSTPDRNTIQPASMRRTQCLRSSGSHLTVLRLTLKKRYVYVRHELPCYILTLRVIQNISISLRDIGSFDNQVDPLKEYPDCRV